MKFANIFVSYNGFRFYMRKSKYCTGRTPFHVNDDMTAKLEGVPCISTSCRVNPRCLRRMNSGKPGHICHSCFANGTTGQYDDLERALESNFLLLTTGLIPDEWLPRFKPSVEIVRIEAFGDLFNVLQARNYLRIARANPRVKFAFFTKNGGTLDRAIKYEGVPANVVFIQSSEFINQKTAPRFRWVNKVFTVYDTEDSARARGVKINCGARSCNKCRRCFTRRGARYVSELLK